MSLDCGGNVGILVRPARELFGEHPLRCGLDLPDCQFLRLDTAGIRTLRSRLKHARPEGLAPAREAALNAYPKACSPATRPSLRRSGPAASPFPCTTTTGQEACWMTAALIGPLPRLSANPQLYHQSCGKGTRIQGRTWPNHIICPQILRRMPATSILWPSAPLPPWAQHPGLDGLSTTQTSPPPIAVYRATLPRAA